MKFDIGLVQFEVDDKTPFLPSMFIAFGEYDRQESVGPVGPTLAKAAPPAYRRTLAISFEPFEEKETKEEALDRGVKEAIKRTKGQPGPTTDRTICGAPAKLIEFTAMGPKKVTLLTLGVVVAFGGFLEMIFVTTLKEKKSELAAREQFKKIVDTFQPGSFYQQFMNKA